MEDVLNSIEKPTVDETSLEPTLTENKQLTKNNEKRKRRHSSL